MKTAVHSYAQPFASPLHIAMVTETYLPEVNCVAITVGRMIEVMRQRQHHVHLIRPRQHKQDVAALEDGYTETLVTSNLSDFPRNSLILLFK